MIDNDWKRKAEVKMQWLHNQRTGVPMEIQEKKVVDARHRVEDLKMANELGIDVEDLDK